MKFWKYIEEEENQNSKNQSISLINLIASMPLDLIFDPCYAYFLQIPRISERNNFYKLSD